MHANVIPFWDDPPHAPGDPGCEGGADPYSPSSARLSGIVGPGHAPPNPQRLFEAARICLRRGREDDARVLAEEACRAAPHDLRYQALSTWLAVRHGVRPGPQAEQVIELLSRAVSRYGEDLELRLYRARVLLRLGRAQDAFEDYHFVADADPLNAEAAREVRLHELRSASGRSPFSTFPK